MIRLGLIGFPLSHSLSPVLHAAALRASGLDGEYLLYPIEPGDTTRLSVILNRLRKGELLGLNVTIPHKQSIIPWLDALTPTAKIIGAVNTLYMRSGELVGDNTDAPGFLADLSISFKEGFSRKTALVMGAGGAARAVIFALLNSGWQVTLAVRKVGIKRADDLINSFREQEGEGGMRVILLEAGDLRLLGSEIDLIINATPVGMSPGSEFLSLAGRFAIS